MNGLEKLSCGLWADLKELGDLGSCQPDRSVYSLS